LYVVADGRDSAHHLMTEHKGEDRRARQLTIRNMLIGAANAAGFYLHEHFPS
jgi:hypothetical protein